MINEISPLEVGVTLIVLCTNFLNFKETRHHVVIEVVIIKAAYNGAKEDH